MINQIRGFLLERSIIVRQGLRFLRELLPDIFAKRTDVLSPRIVRIVIDLAGDWRQLDERIETVTDEIETLAKSEDSCRRVMTVQSIGPIISSAMVAAIGSGVAFAKGRDFSAWVGSCPSRCRPETEPSSGVSPSAATVTCACSSCKQSGSFFAAGELAETRLRGLARSRRSAPTSERLAAALANKLARIAWTVLVQERSYQARVTKAAT